VISGVAANLAAQRLDLSAQTRGLERVLDGDAQLLEIEGFTNEIVSPEFKCVLDVIQLRAAVIMMTGERRRPS
jgi:hypothetical protein